MQINGTHICGLFNVLILTHLFMSTSKESAKEDELDLSDELFLKSVGSFLMNLRKKAGYPTIRLFSDAMDMGYTQYQRYESGSNITLIVLRRILSFYNLKVDDWLKLDLTNDSNELDKIVETMKRARVDQLLYQVSKLESINAAKKLGTKEVSRYVDVLEFCIHPKSRKEILEVKLKMVDSVNTLKRVAGKLLDYKWLEPTNKINKNAPNQKYITTERGRKAILLK